MTTGGRSGDVRSRVDFEGTDVSAAGLQRIEQQLAQLIPVSTRTEQAFQQVNRSMQAQVAQGRQVADSLERIKTAFTPLRVSLETVNQLRAAFGQWTQAVRATGQAIEWVIGHNQDLTRDMDQLESAADRVADAFARGVDKSGELGDSMRLLSTGLWGLENAAAQAGEQLHNAIEAAAQAAGTVAGSPALGQLLAWAAAEGIHAIAPGRRATVRPKEGEASFTEAFGAVGEAVAGAAEGSAAEARERASRRGAGGGGSRPQYITDEQLLEELSGLAARAQASMEAAGETFHDFLGELQEDGAEMAERADERLAQIEEEAQRRKIELQEEAHERQMAMLEAEAEAHNILAEKELERAELQRQADEERFDRLKANLSALSTASEELGGIFEQIAEAEEERGENADGWRVAVGVAKGTYYAIEAVAAAAEAAREGMHQNYGGMAEGIISAAGLAAASGYMFSKLARTGSSGVTGPTAGTFTPTTPSRIEAEETGDEPDEPIVVIGLGTSDAGVAAAMVHANEALLRDGRTPMRGARGVGYVG